MPPYATHARPPREKNLARLWIGFAIIVALGLSVPTLLGIPAAFAREGDEYGSTAHMPIPTLLVSLALDPVPVALVSVVLAWSAFGLWKRRMWALHVFLVAAPAGFIALASVFPRSLWREDIPLTSVAVFLYVPLAFLLTRSRSLDVFHAPSTRWVNRGGLGLALGGEAALVMYVILRYDDPYWEVERWRDLIPYWRSLSVTEVLAWSYNGALVAVSIPVTFRRRPGRHHEPRRRVLRAQGRSET